MIVQLVPEEFQLKGNFLMECHIFALIYTKPFSISRKGSGRVEPFPLDNEVFFQTKRWIIEKPYILMSKDTPDACACILLQAER